MSVYTFEHFCADRAFRAAPGQEIDEDVYNHFLNALPPRRLPRRKETEGYIAGFLAGGEYDEDPATGWPRYLAFGMRGGRHYYIGLI